MALEEPKVLRLDPKADRRRLDATWLGGGPLIHSPIAPFLGKY